MTTDRTPMKSHGAAQGGASSRDTGNGGRPLFATLVASSPTAEQGRAVGLIGSTVFHIILIGCLVWATMAVGQEVVDQEQLVSIMELPQEPQPPPPPPPPPEIRIEPTLEPVARGFQELVLPTIVPPEIPPPQIGVRITEKDFRGEGVPGGRHDGDTAVTRTRNDVMDRPGFTPMTVAPELTNTADVQRALVRSYPPILRESGVGGTPIVWFLIDETGRVIKTQLSKSSGYAALDEAAMKVAEIMKFSPAMNHDRKVTVWVELPIVFRVH